MKIPAPFNLVEYRLARPRSYPVLGCQIRDAFGFAEVVCGEIVFQETLSGFKGATAGDASHIIERVNRLPIPSDLLMCLYNRFVELIREVLLPLTIYLSRRMGKSTPIAFIDSTAIYKFNLTY